MYNTTFNLIAVSLFLCASLFLGLWAGRGVKTMRDYAIANKNLFVGALMATMVATIYNPTNMGVRYIYMLGLKGMITLLTFAFSTFMFGVFFFPRLVNFRTELTLPDIMNSLYGKYARFLTAFISIFFCLFIIIAQLVASGNMGITLGLPAPFVIGIVGTIITFYTFLGGVRSVAKTDVFQALVIIVGLLVFFFFANRDYSYIKILQEARVKSDHLSLSAFGKDLIKRPGSLLFWSLFPTMIMSPPVIQRVLMSRTKKNIKQMFTSFAIVYPFLCFLILGVTIKRFVISNAPKTIEDISDFDLVGYLCTSTIGQVAFLLVVCAMIVSTIDSFLNAVAIIFVHDVINVIQNEKDEKKTMRKVRFTTIAIGALCTMLGLLWNKKEIVDLLGYAMVFFSAVSIPFFMGCLGFKGSSRSFIINITAFFVVVGGAYTSFQWQVPPISSILNFITERIFKARHLLMGETFYILQSAWLLAVIISIIAFLVTHYLENKGFLFINLEEDLWKENKHTFTSYFEKSFTLGNPSSIGFFTFIFTLGSVLIPYKSPLLNETLLLFLRLISLVLSFIIMTEGHWKDRLKPYFNKVYHVTLWYCWAFLPTFLILADPNGAIVFYAVSSIIFLGLHTYRAIFWFMSLTAIVSAISYNKILTGIFFPILGAKADWLLPSCILALTIVMTFFRKLHQEKERMEALMVNFKIARGELLLSHETNSAQVYDALHEKHAMMKEMQKCIDRLQSKEVDKDILEKLEDIMGYYNYIGESSSSYLNIVIEKHPLENLLNDAREIITYETLPLGKLTLHNESSASIVVGDSFQIKNLIANALHIFADVYPDTDVNCFVNDVYLDYEVPAIYKKEPEKAIRFIFTNNQEKCNASGQDYRPYDSNTKIETLNHIGVLENKRITRAHYGFLSIEKEGDTLIQTYVIPVNLKNIRPKIDRYVVEDLRDLEQIESDTDKGFLRLAEAHGLDKDHIREALKVAKHYHYHQKRKSGESYYLHPLAVATILLENKDVIQVDQGMLADLVIAALLHDIFEDTPYTSKQLRTMFGNNVAEIVKQVSHLYNRANRPKVKVGKMETLHALVQNGNEYAMLIKVLDRLHNMRTLGAKESDRQLAIAEETKVLFIPMARRLGMQRVANELTVLVEEILGK